MEGRPHVCPESLLSQFTSQAGAQCDATPDTPTLRDAEGKVELGKELQASRMDMAAVVHRHADAVTASCG